MDYAEYHTAMSKLLMQDDARFEVLLPQCITYAEQRIYRELDLVNTQITTESQLTANIRQINVPDDIIVLQSMNAVTPAATQPNDGTRVPLRRVTIEFLNFVYPSLAADYVGVPQYYAIIGGQQVPPWAQTVVFGPAPDDSYYAEFIGTVRPTPLSETQENTFISDFLPDLLIVASMVFATGGIQRNFGAQSDQPQSSQSWESQYRTLMGSAAVEEARRKAGSTGWQPYLPLPLAQPPRT